MPHPASAPTGRPKPARGGTACFWIALALVLAVSFCRDPGAFLHPVLAYEDGRDVFAHFYNHRGPEQLLRSYAGYVALIPNLVGWCALALPVELAPRILALVPLALSSLALAWLALPAYRWLFPDDALRAGLAVVLAAVPATNHLFLGNTMYSGWSALLLLVLWSLAPSPTRILPGLGRLVALALLGWSHPLSVVVIPVHLALALHPSWLPRTPGTRRRPGLARGFHAAVVVLLLLYQAIGVEHGAARVVNAGPADEPATAAASVPEGPTAKDPNIAALATRFVLERVVFGTLAGEAVVRGLYRSGHGAFGAWAGLALIALGAAVVLARRRRLDRHRAFALATWTGTIVALTVLYVVARDPGLEILRESRAFRYFWVQRLLLLVLVAWGATVFLPRRDPARARAPSSRRPSPLLAAGIVAWLTILNPANNSVYRVDPAQGARVAEFTAEIARQEELRGGRINIYARLERGRWSLEINR